MKNWLLTFAELSAIFFSNKRVYLEYKKQTAKRGISHVVDPPPTLACFNCGQIDKVKKVTAIVAAETSTEEIRGGAIGISNGGLALGRMRGETTKMSNIAALLLPPNAPDEQPQNSTTNYIFPTILLFIIFLVVGLSFNIILAVIALVIATPIVFIVFKKINTSNKLHQHQLQEKNKEEWRLYDQAFERWRRTFYCARCHMIFEPGDELTVCAPVEDIKEYLYR